VAAGILLGAIAGGAGRGAPGIAGVGWAGLFLLLPFLDLHMGPRPRGAGGDGPTSTSLFDETDAALARLPSPSFRFTGERLRYGEPLPPPRQARPSAREG
jgi:hypothetical protein